MEVGVPHPWRVLLCEHGVIIGRHPMGRGLFEALTSIEGQLFVSCFA